MQKTKSHPGKEVTRVYPAIGAEEWLKPHSSESQVRECYSAAVQQRPSRFCSCSWFNWQNNPKTNLILCSGLAWTCAETTGAAGTFLQKQMWKSIVSKMKEKSNILFSEYFLSSWVIHFLLSLYLFMCHQWFHNGTHDNLFKVDKICYSKSIKIIESFNNGVYRPSSSTSLFLRVRKLRPEIVMQRINDNSYLVAEPGSEQKSSHFQFRIHFYITDHSVSFWKCKFEQKRKKNHVISLDVFVDVV